MAIMSGKLRRGGGFSLVELMIVVAVLSILVTILVPTVQKALQMGYASKSRAFIKELSDGCLQYRVESGNRYYPGQQYPELLKGHSPAGPFSGAQLLSIAMYTKKGMAYKGDGSATDGYGKGNSVLPYYPERMMGANNLEMKDGFTKPLPILYYVSRLDGDKASASQYVAADNADHFAPPPTNWTDFVFNKHKDALSVKPRSPGGFFIVGAGIDRQFGTRDDVQSN